jgi:uncharacterized ParB-like nuclease family protein
MSVLERLDAEEDWQKAHRKVLYQEVVCLIKRCSVDLLSFQDVSSGLHLHQKLYRGFQNIPLDQIRGSVGRFNDFDSAFMPRKGHMRERWQGVDQAMMQGKTPPIDVYQVGEIYFVVDGNHRVSVSRQHGYKMIEAYVTEFQTPFKPSAEADLDEILIKSEQTAFMEKAGETNAEAANSMVFTCAGCYEDVSKQVEIYRQQKQSLGGAPYSFEQAFPEWRDEVYGPAIEAIRENDLASQFPDRTEADLFIWSWQNNQAIEELELNDAQTAAEE